MKNFAPNDDVQSSIDSAQSSQDSLNANDDSPIDLADFVADAIELVTSFVDD